MVKYPLDYVCSYCKAKTFKYIKGLCKPCYDRKRHRGTSEPYQPKTPRRYKFVRTAGGTEYEHRIIAKAQLGEVVHHRDKDGFNNEPDNLQKFDSQAEHLAEHARLRREQKNGRS